MQIAPLGAGDDNFKGLDDEPFTLISRFTNPTKHKHCPCGHVYCHRNNLPQNGSDTDIYNNGVGIIKNNILNDKKNSRHFPPGKKEDNHTRLAYGGAYT